MLMLFRVSPKGGLASTKVGNYCTILEKQPTGRRIAVSPQRRQKSQVSFRLSSARLSASGPCPPSRCPFASVTFGRLIRLRLPFRPPARVLGLRRRDSRGRELTDPAQGIATGQDRRWAERPLSAAHKNGPQSSRPRSHALLCFSHRFPTLTPCTGRGGLLTPKAPSKRRGWRALLRRTRQSPPHGIADAGSWQAR
ncbi:hypothetical protein GQ53DRAFT_212587 [Thozetella sp. PMI_491]|nr:hypothetical protein GQ53DRAFT_212587 [Thozetella sp. PMI_491]